MNLLCCGTNATYFCSVFPVQHVSLCLRDHMRFVRVTFLSDGFSAGGTNLLFENNHVQNGDDCLTVGNGAKNITWQ